MEKYKLPVEITWKEDDQAEVDVICDACENRYVLLSTDITDLHLCGFCGHYLDIPGAEDGGSNEPNENSWD